jgi:hypothetical protein
VANERYLTVFSEISGRATLKLIGMFTAQTAPDGRYRFKALNTNFYGRIVMDLFDDDSESLQSRYQIIEVEDYRNLGGDLDVMDAQALTLTKFDRLWGKSNNVVFPKKSNRGIFANGNGVIHVENKKCIRVESQIAVNGSLYVTGAGTLELACPVAFGSEGVSAKPNAKANDSLVITGSTVRVCAPGAIDGLAVKFTDLGAIEVAVDMGDEEMVRYGARNSKATVPFSPNKGESKIPFSMSVVGEAPPLQSFVVGAVTVKDVAADAVRAMLPERAPKLFPGYLSEWQVVPDDEGDTVTFAVKCYKKGMIFSVR